MLSKQNQFHLNFIDDKTCAFHVSRYICLSKRKFRKKNMFRRYSLIDPSPPSSKLSMLSKTLHTRSPPPEILVEHVPLSEITPPQRKSRSLHSSPVYRKKDSSSPNSRMAFTQKEVFERNKNNNHHSLGNSLGISRYSRLNHHHHSHNSTMSAAAQESLLMRTREQFVSLVNKIQIF